MANIEKFNLPALLDHLGNSAGPHGAPPLADGEAQPLLHGDGGDQLGIDRDVVARHDHLHSLGQHHRAGHVGGPEVKLGPVAGEKGRVLPGRPCRVPEVHEGPAP